MKKRKDFFFNCPIVKTFTPFCYIFLLDPIFSRDVLYLFRLKSCSVTWNGNVGMKGGRRKSCRSFSRGGKEKHFKKVSSLPPNSFIWFQAITFWRESILSFSLILRKDSPVNWYFHYLHLWNDGAIHFLGGKVISRII